MTLFELVGKIIIKDQEARDKIKDTTDSAHDAGNKMVSAFKKVGAAVGTFLAVDKIVSFGKACVESAATVKAQTAQFEAAFGDLQESAEDVFESIGKETGILATRLKVVGTGAFSQFKGAGLDAAEALDKTAEYTNLAADAAAYYDMSLEEADSLMRSFIRGNTEAGDRIGLFTSETQRNEAALQKLGKKYKDCTEAEKQMIMLDIASSIYESSGAMGQAAREADGYENVMGNLRESWRQFTAILGAPILAEVTPIIQRVTESVSGLVTKFSEGTNPVQVAIDKLKDFAGWCETIAAYALETFQPVLSDLQTAFTNVKDALQPLVDKVSEYVTSGQAAKDITDTVKGAIDLLAEGYSNAKTFIQDVVQGFKDAVEWGREHKTIVSEIAISVGTLTAAITLYNIAQAIKNAGGIVELVQLGALWVGITALTVAETAHTVATTIATAATSAFGAVLAFITSPITLVVLAIGALIAIGVALYQNWDVVKAKCSELWASVTETFSRIKENVSGKVSEMKASTLAKFGEIKSGIEDKIAAARDFVGNAIKKIKGFFDFEWSLPHINLPHFSVSGGEAPWGFMGKGSLPSVSVDWYAKAMDNAMVLTDPTIFGFSSASNKLLGGGEAGNEVVAGEAHLMQLIGSVVEAKTATLNNQIVSLLADILNAIASGNDEMVQALIAGHTIVCNEREIARTVKQYA